MNTRTARKIERFARTNGISFRRAASELAQRGAKVRRYRATAKISEEVNQERFEAMRKQQAYLYE